LSVVIARPQSGRGDPVKPNKSGDSWIAASAFGLLAMTRSVFFRSLLNLDVPRTRTYTEQARVVKGRGWIVSNGILRRTLRT
jgi:hypothetical protein